MQIFIDVAYLILFFGQFRETLIRNCIDGSTDKDLQNICNGSFNVPNVSKWTTLVGMIVGLIIQFSGFHFFFSHHCENELGRLMTFFSPSKRGREYCRLVRR